MMVFYVVSWHFGFLSIAYDVNAVRHLQVPCNAAF
jgi:hypothetical protein